MGFPMKPQQVDRQGIRHINAEMIAEAARQGRRWKLVCSAEREGLSVKGMVRPTLVDCASPMYGVEGTTSILQFETDVLGRLSIIEENPGPLTTAYGCLADFLNAVRS
jgi:homoserine dehydrogenase